MDLYRLRKADIPTASQALAEAFFEDPFVRRICPDDATRHPSILPVFRFSAGLSVHNAEGWAISPAMEGVALWMYSWKMGVTPWRWLLLGGLSIRRGLAHEGYRELTRVSDRIDRAREGVQPARFLYLACLGVQPAFRRQGYARALVQQRAAQAAAEGLPTLVETNTPEALAFYKSVGFRVKTSFRAAELDYYVLEYN